MSKEGQRKLKETIDKMNEPFKQKSDNLLKTVCFICRGERCHNAEHQASHYQVGWKFEYPKKRNVRAWKKLEIAMKNDNMTHPMVRRSKSILVNAAPGDHQLFSWAHLYGNSTVTPRINKPRHRRWLSDPKETAKHTIILRLST